MIVKVFENYKYTEIQKVKKTSFTYILKVLHENRTLITPDFAGNAFDVQIIYDIIGADVPAQQLEFVLQPTR